MKNVTISALALIAALSFAGCSSNSNSPNGVNLQGSLCAGPWCIVPNVGVNLPPPTPPVVVAQQPVVYQQPVYVPPLPVSPVRTIEK